MEAPEKIYVPTEGDELHYHMACPNNEFQESIEYTRTDAFIKRAVEYIANNMRCDGYTLQTKAKFIKDFKNYMKGEKLWNNTFQNPLW